MQRLGAYRLAVSLFGLTDLAADSIVDRCQSDRQDKANDHDTFVPCKNLYYIPGLILVEGA